jgi:hypothetical protein
MKTPPYFFTIATAISKYSGGGVMNPPTPWIGSARNPAIEHVAVGKHQESGFPQADASQFDARSEARRQRWRLLLDRRAVRRLGSRSPKGVWAQPKRLLENNRAAHQGGPAIRESVDLLP